MSAFFVAFHLGASPTAAKTQKKTHILTRLKRWRKVSSRPKKLLVLHHKTEKDPCDESPDPTTKDKEAVARRQEGHNHDKIKSLIRQVGDPQTGEQKYQRSSHPTVKVLNLRCPSLGIWQRDWESTGNLAMSASRLWLQAFQRTERNRDSSLWRTQTKFCAHQEPEERSSDPTGGWTKTAC